MTATAFAPSVARRDSKGFQAPPAINEDDLLLLQTVEDCDRLALHGLKAIAQAIVGYTRLGLSQQDIKARLQQLGAEVSVRTIKRRIAEAREQGLLEPKSGAQGERGQVGTSSSSWEEILKSNQILQKVTEMMQLIQALPGLPEDIAAEARLLALEIGPEIVSRVDSADACGYKEMLDLTSDYFKMGQRVDRIGALVKAAAYDHLGMPKLGERA